MFYELIATVFAGFAAGGFAMVLRRSLGGRLPAWVVPVAAGAAMFGFSIWSEYTWADRTAANLQDGIEVVRMVESPPGWRPWTYFAPLRERFIAADVGTTRTHPDAPALRLSTIYLYARWQPIRALPQLIDCAQPAYADLPGGEPPALPVPEEIWRPLPPEDPLVTVLCS